MTPKYILVVDDEPDIRQLVSEILEDEGYAVITAESAEEAKKIRLNRRPDLVLLDIWMPGQDGISLLKDWKENESLGCPVVMMSGHGTIETAVEATRLGAHDFIEKPLSMAKMILCIENAMRSDQLFQENKDLRNQIMANQFPVGSSEVMANLRDQAQRMALDDSSIIIYGESGVGREVFARYMHNQSKRNNSPFIKASIPSLPAEKQEDLLFGYQTYDNDVNYGLLDEAQGGTLYLSDISALSTSAQELLFYTLREKYFIRMGGAEKVPLHLKLIVSSQHDLKESVNASLFRDDLYQELSTIPLIIPSLRDHPEDVPELLNYYVNQQVEREALPYRHFSVSAQNYLRNHDWPGNIRELSNLVQRLLILGTDSEITQEEVEETMGSEIPIFTKSLTSSTDKLFDLPLRIAREQFERDYLDYQLERVEGNVSKLAEIVQMERTHLYRKMRSLKIDPKQYGK